MTAMTRQIHLVRRPDGAPKAEDFIVAETPMPEPREGQVLVRNIWMSVDPYMRRSMDADGKDLEPWPIGAALNGPSVGRVVASRNPAFAEGDLVESMSGWQEHFLSNGDDFVPYISADNALARRTAAGARPRDYIGLCGMAAMTSYAGMVCLAKTKAGDTAVISSGAGTVGSLACQIAKINGLRVVTSAGSDQKVQWLRDTLHVEAFNYKTRPIAESLADACPHGIDLVLENASPEHLSACLPFMNDLGTILITGFVSVYSTGGKSPPIQNFEYALDKFLTIKAYRFMDSMHAYDDFVRDMIRWRAEGRLILPETVHAGLEKAPEALASLFSGESFGKVLVKLADDPADAPLQ